MLSNVESMHIHRLTLHIRGSRKLPAKDLEATLAYLEDALVRTREAADAMSAAQTARQAANPNRARGRPPTQWYEVSMGSLWSAKRLGLMAAMDLVTAELAKDPAYGHPPSINSMQVMMSTRGSWYRHLITSNGEYGLSVRRCDAD